ncbi:hypothetical protein AAFC00_000021 [Neodothiora populina]|uniref:RNA polymerase I associated factor, A49-like protein n=1 Tax=Neodothiora populina TaxID=2781224 RepID=A0ABR3P1Z3_9PEZI
MAVKDNKRKRDEGHEARRSKKTESSAPIKVHFPALKDELHPIVASSPGLNIPSTTFKTYSKPTMTTCSNHSDTPTPSSHSLLLHSSAHARLDYTAQQEASGTRSDYIAVYDEATSTLQVLPAHPLTLRTSLRSETQDVAAQNAARTFARQREELGMAFGTKKARKALNARYENAITTGADRDKVAGKLDAVEAAVMASVDEASAAMPERQELQDSILASKPIPRPNLHAQKIEDAYPLSVLVPSGEMRALAVKDWQDAVEANEDVKTSSRFVANRLRSIVKSEDVAKLKALRYLLLLLDFYNSLQPSRGGKKVPIKDKLKAKMPEWSDALIDAARRRFADNNELNKWHLDNITTHMAAVSLYIDNWRTDTFDLREDLRLENKQMSQYFLELGCRVAAPTEREQTELKMPSGSKAIVATRRVAKLKLPLEFPKTRNPPRRR